MKERLARNDTLRTILVPVAILVSGVGIAATVYQGDREQRRQAALDFQMEAATIIMAEPTCARALARAEQLRLLFPARLPDDFPDLVNLFLQVQREKFRQKRGDRAASAIPTNLCDDPLSRPLLDETR